MGSEKTSALDDHLTNSRDRHNCDGYRDNTGECLWCEENHHARAELSAIREEIHTRGVTIDHLSAENARMREALEELIAADDAWWSSVGAEGNTTALERMDDARTLARAALGGRDEGS